MDDDLVWQKAWLVTGLTRHAALIAVHVLAAHSPVIYHNRVRIGRDEQGVFTVHERDLAQLRLRRVASSELADHSRGPEYMPLRLLCPGYTAVLQIREGTGS